MITRARQLMEQLNRPVDVTRDLEEYSLAMQQMIAIARAGDMDCKVLILDEPTSSLDDVEVEKLFTLMRSLRDKEMCIRDRTSTMENRGRNSWCLVTFFTNFIVASPLR